MGRLVGLLSGVLLLFLSGCHAGENPSWTSANRRLNPGFDVNDVSILYTRPQTQAEIAFLPNIFELGALSGENFAMLLGQVSPDDDFNIYGRAPWRIIGVRFDPCVKEDPKDAGCLVEFRLVVQPVVWLKPSEVPRPHPGAVLIEDHAFHLIYRHSQETAAEITKDLYDLKQSAGVNTNGVPLSPHPAMEKEGLNGPFAKRLHTILQKYAQESSLHEATVMLQIGLSDWRFGRTLMGGNGKLEEAKIPFIDWPFVTLIGSTARPDGRYEEYNEIKPASKAQDNMNLMADSNTPSGEFFKLDGDTQRQQSEMALRIDNPLAHTPSTVDCASCHLASRALAKVHGREYLDVQDGNPNRYPAPPNVTTINKGDVDELSFVYSVRAFGYGAIHNGSYWVTTQRVVNDSARVAAFLNDQANY